MRKELTPPADGVQAAPEGAPRLISASGVRVEELFWKFLTAPSRNRHTRRAYWQAMADFALFLEERGVETLLEVKPAHVAGYVEQLGKTRAAPTVKLRLAAIRSLLDWLMVHQAIPANPAASVRGPQRVEHRGHAPALTPEEARALFRHIDSATLVGKRDRALIGVMLYGLARVSDAVGMKVQDFKAEGHRYWLVFSQKKSSGAYEVPAHHLLEDWLTEYIEAAGIRQEQTARLFRAAIGRSGILSERPMLAGNVLHMVRRRCRDAGIERPVSCHSLRVTGITTFLANGGSLEMAQRLAGHTSRRTTQHYVRRNRMETVDEVERIIL